MKPAPPDPAELIHRVRQQLILAQVRIMELEDTLEETTNRLAESRELRQAAQTLADQKLDEAAHLEKVRAELQAQYEHLQHVQHATNVALNSTRTELAATAQALANERATAAGLVAQLAQLTEAHGRLEALHGELTVELREIAATSAARQERITELDSELRTMKSSRSWRWTAWLRSLERLFGAKKQ